MFMFSPGMSLCPPPRQSNFQNTLVRTLFFSQPYIYHHVWGYMMFKLQENAFAHVASKTFPQVIVNLWKKDNCSVLSRQHFSENPFRPNMSKNGFIQKLSSVSC